MKKNTTKRFADIKKNNEQWTVWLA